MTKESVLKRCFRTSYPDPVAFNSVRIKRDFVVNLSPVWKAIVLRYHLPRFRCRVHFPE